MVKKLITAILSLQCIFFASLAWAEPENIIIFIGDGMGVGHVKASGIYAYGTEGSLLFESFPYQAEVTTYSADSSVTDSAAAATAIASAVKVNNGVISVESPGDGSELYTLLEYFKDRGKSTGLVTTVPMTNATPASFAAHESSRYNYSNIADDYFNQTRPNVLFGGGGDEMSVSQALNAGYTVFTNRVGMQRLNTDTETLVSGQFGYALPYEYDGSFATTPHLSELTATALDILDNDPDGFFIMIEGGLIDWAAHANNLNRDIFETIEFDNSVQVALDWAQGRSDTLIIVTADHDTGGLTVTQNNGQGVLPDVAWATEGHTGANVGVYAIGQNAHLISGVMDNTDFFAVATASSTVSTDYYCDDDNDNFIAASVSGSCPAIGCEPSGCQLIAGDDCDDNDLLEFPGQIWYEDGDGDLYSSGDMIVQCARPTDYYASSELTATSGDCNDNDINVNPEAGVFKKIITCDAIQRGSRKNIKKFDNLNIL